MHRARRRLTGAAAVAVALWVSPVVATPEDIAAAEALFQQGRSLMAEGKFAEACPKLAESQKLDSAVGTLLYLAECYEKNGQTASAWATFELAASEGRKAHQQERERIARLRAEKLRPRLSRLSIVVSADAAVAGLSIRRDGTEVGRPSWGIGLPVDPGEHVIEAKAPGKVPWRRKIQIEGEGTVEEVALPTLRDTPEAPDSADAAAEIAITPPRDALAAPGDESGQSDGSSQRLGGLVTAGGGVVVAGIGGALLYIGQDKEDASYRECDPVDSSQCTQDGLDLIDEADGYNLAGAIVAGAGGAVFVLGAVLYLTAPSSPRAASSWTVTPALSRRWSGLQVGGHF